MRYPTVAPTGSPNVCAMRSAAARAASLRGSSIRILPLVNLASSIAKGTRVVFPAPGGACKTARPLERSASISLGKTGSIGNANMPALSLKVLWTGKSRLGTSNDMDINDLAKRIKSGERRAIAKGITLVESDRADHRAQAADLLSRLSGAGQALRIGLSGTPGVGKSTFIESFGMMLTGQGLRVAVLAVDPSSTRSGGSILGDKTRMDRLSREPLAFIRPSPSQSHLGGVARRTREAIAIVEAAGFDVVLIETVGVGQSETMVAEMTDVFMLLLAPAGGDELQGVKRGIMEIADLIVVNKADGDLKTTATRTCADYAGALRLLRKRVQDPDDFPKAVLASALTEQGLDAVWDNIQILNTWRQDNGHFDKRRAAQALHWFQAEVQQGVLATLQASPAAQSKMKTLQSQVTAGTLPASAAASQVLNALFAKESQT